MAEDRLAEFRRVGCVVWSTDGACVAAGDNYGAVARHALVDGVFEARGAVHVSPRGAPVAALCAPVPGLVAAATADGTLALLPWDAAPATTTTTTTTTTMKTLATGGVLDGMCAARGGDGGACLVAAPCGTVYDVATLSACGSLACTAPTAVCAVGDGRCVATGGRDGSVQLWDLRAPQTPAAVLGAPAAGGACACCCVAASADGRLVAAGCEGGDVLVWHAGVQALVARADAGAPVVDVAFAHDGTLLCVPLGARAFVAYALGGTRGAADGAAGAGLLREAYRATDAGDGCVLALCERVCDDTGASVSASLPVVLPPRPLRAVGCADGTVAVFDGAVRVVSLAWPRGP